MSGCDWDDDETTVSRPAYPFLLIDHILDNAYSADDRVIKRYEKLDYPKVKKITIYGKTLKEEVCNAMTVGFARDGLRFEHHGDNGIRSISYKPSDPELKDMTVYLPDLPTGSKIQNIAMSSLPNRDNDWVVGVKLSGSQLCICRPFGSSKWIDLKTTPQSIDPLSNLMFSKRDQRFYIPSPGGNYLCYLNEYDVLQFIDLRFDDLPKSVLQELVDVSSCSRTDHLVESPTGGLFLVKWYSEDSMSVEDNDSENPALIPVTKKMMVFREGLQSDPGEKTMIYTEDIGDLCIFLGHSEAYCVPASSSPGLNPNCIYFVGRNFGVYDLTTKTCTTFYGKDYKPLRKTEFPYWPSPVPL